MAKRDRTYCCVPQCTSLGSRNPELSFHKFPPDSSKLPVTLLDGSRVLVPRRLEWMRILRIGKEVSSRSKVCSKHFIPSDYISEVDTSKRPRLRPTCVPSRFLPVSENVNKDSKTTQSTKRQASHKKPNRKKKVQENWDEKTQDNTEEKGQELTIEIPSEWKVYSELDEIMGDYVNLNRHLKDTSTRCEEMPVEQRAAKSGPVTILRLTPKEVNEDGEVYYIDDDHEEENDDDCEIEENIDDDREVEENIDDHEEENIDNTGLESDESQSCNEPSSSPCNSSKSNKEKKGVESKFIEELCEEFKETKRSLADTDKKLLEMLSYQNNLIKVRSKLCRTQNSLLTSLLEKME